jgi:putative cardiolipin synthase
VSRFVTAAHLFSALLCSSLLGPAAHSTEADPALTGWIAESCPDCVPRLADQTGAYLLEKGEEALLGRAWLTAHATESIDVQYFIWSTDNVGILAAEQLLRAAERGVRVRVLVDDFLIDAENRTLLLLAAHAKVEIRLYNPNITVGRSTWQRVRSVFTDFRAINQRMHDKTAIFDGVAGITGGRNMADEYFDFDHDYNFRDRDILLLGRAVGAMADNFEEFWNSPFAVPVERVLEGAGEQVSPADVAERAAELHAYAADGENFAPEVRDAIASVSERFPDLLGAMVWGDVEFISDVPGKNAGTDGLSGGGASTRSLIAALEQARESVIIQSPYLVMPEGGIELFAALVERGVRVRISTNSLASTDNLQAFSGYLDQREKLLAAGVELHEFRPRPALREELIERYPSLERGDPVFAIHAKSLVIDDRVLYVGTFNLDPRSANLNTEVGALADSPVLAVQLRDSIERDMRPENSWQTTDAFDPDGEASLGKRIVVWLYSLLPLEPVL